MAVHSRGFAWGVVVWSAVGLTSAGSAFALDRQQQEPQAQQPAAQRPPDTPPAAGDANAPEEEQPSLRNLKFDLGEIVVVGTADGTPVVGGAVLEREPLWAFDRSSLDQAVNLVPGVSSTLDSNGRRNESDVFVRGFGRWQVPLLMDGVRIYLPSDNRLDFSRFLTSDVAAVQVQKGYASVLDGPGAMGGAINLVTRQPTRPLEAEASVSAGGRDSRETWSAYAMAGTRQTRYYAQGSVNYSERSSWTLPGGYTPVARSLQPSGERIGSDTKDWRVNAKVGFTPSAENEYAFNYTKQSGEKGAPLNVYNNPPVPGNSYWRWPYWDIQNVAFHSKTRIGAKAYAKVKAYYDTFRNGLDAFDDATYTTQSAQGRFRSPYDDHAYGTSIEMGTGRWSAHSLKAAAHLRWDFHSEQQTNRPTHPTLSTTEPKQEQAQRTWSVALEDTVHVSSTVDVVGGVSLDNYLVTEAEEYNTTRGIFEYPKGGSDAFNWQAAVIWRTRRTGELHASVSDRARFPVIYELYSTRLGFATPNPSLGPERATNVELGWKRDAARGLHVEAAVFASDVRGLIQTVILPDTTTQTQNVGTGSFYGAEVAMDARAGAQLQVGGNYTFVHRRITDALQPSLRPTGVPTHKAFLYGIWHPIARLGVTPSLDVAGDRWSDVNVSPVLAFPYVRTGAYTVLNLAIEYALTPQVDVVVGARNMNDDLYELAWGFPQPGRTFYLKTRAKF